MPDAGDVLAKAKFKELADKFESKQATWVNTVGMATPPSNVLYGTSTGTTATYSAASLTGGSAR